MFGLFGCLGVAGVGALVVLFFIGVIVSIPTEPEFTYDDDMTQDTAGLIADPGTQDPPERPAERTGPAEANPKGVLANYGPPTGPTVKSRLRPPWSELNLPMGRGVPSFNDETTLIVMYGGGEVEPLGGLWRTALQRELGYQVEYDFSNDGLMSVSMTKGANQLVMAVSESMGNIIVSISIVD